MMKRMFDWDRMLLLIAAVVIACSVVSITGCAQMGSPAPQTFKQKLVVGYSTVAGVRDVATNLLVAGKITAGDAQNVQNQADQARNALDIARDMNTRGQSLAAADKLSATIVTLQALQSYLTARGGQ